MKRESLKKYNIPDKPGVYFFKHKKEMLYIGKATSLRSRVKSYFARELFLKRGPLLVEMLENANRLEWQETDSVLEALILEASLIKRYQPKYNTDGKSDKSWNYVCITKDKIPEIIFVREHVLAFEKPNLLAYYGPFTNGGQLREAMKIIRRIFPYLDKSASKRANYLFYKQVGLAPDIITEEGRMAYLSNIKNIRLLFEGKKKKIIRDLEKEMKSSAKKHEFEKAEELKRQLFALKHINDIALLKNDNYTPQNFSGSRNESSARGRKVLQSFVSRIEAYDIAHMGGKNMVGVMVVVEDGQPAKGEYRKFKIKTINNTNDTGALREVVSRRLGHVEWPLPHLIVVDGGVAQYRATLSMLKEKGFNIDIVSVVKDEKHRAKGFMGGKDVIERHKREILLSNSEAHRFGIAYHKNLRGKNFLK